MARSRRKAREAALRALYELEVGKPQLRLAVREMLENADLSDELADYSEKIVTGVREHLAEIDDKLAATILEYDLDRIASVDRNVLRIAAYELFYEDTIPPAVTINEAIEVAKKYSTAESGKFVNGVLGKLLQNSAKASWTPIQGLTDQIEEIYHEPVPKVVEETVDADSEEARKLAKIGGWRLKAPEEPT